MERGEMYIGRLIADEIVTPAGASLMASNALPEGQTYIGNAQGVAAGASLATLLAGLVAVPGAIASLFAGIGYYPVFAGVSEVEADDDASVVIDVTGVLAGDIAFAVMIAGATPQGVAKVACAEDTITITLSGNGGAGTQIAYIVFRPSA